MKRAGNIELLRFVFAIVIVLHHSMVEGLLAMTGGFLSVEFFYMITGAFMAKSCKKYIEENKQVEKIDITVKHTYKYLMKRIISILPELFISTIIGLVFFYNIGYINAQSYNFFRHVVNDFLFVQSLGMPVASVSGIVWYLSSMYFGIIIIYPIIRGCRSRPRPGSGPRRCQRQSPRPACFPSHTAAGFPGGCCRSPC